MIMKHIILSQLLGLILIALVIIRIFQLTNKNCSWSKIKKVTKSSADRNETSKQFYENYIVKDLPDSYYI